MKKIAFLTLLLSLFLACKDYDQDIRGIPGPAEVLVEAPLPELTLEERLEVLEEEGYEAFLMEEEDTTYLMQKYFMVFLKTGPNRNQDSATVNELQKQHLEYLNKIAEEGYASLFGPFEDDGEIRGIVVFNTPTREMADSLARLNPMVQAGRLAVEVHPWWVSKGGKLN